MASSDRSISGSKPTDDLSAQSAETSVRHDARNSPSSPPRPQDTNVVKSTSIHSTLPLETAPDASTPSLESASLTRFPTAIHAMPSEMAFFSASASSSHPPPESPFHNSSKQISPSVSAPLRPVASSTGSTSTSTGPIAPGSSISATTSPSTEAPAAEAPLSANSIVTGPSSLRGSSSAFLASLGSASETFSPPVSGYPSSSSLQSSQAGYDHATPAHLAPRPPPPPRLADDDFSKSALPNESQSSVSSSSSHTTAGAASAHPPASASTSASHAPHSSALSASTSVSASNPHNPSTSITPGHPPSSQISSGPQNPSGSNNLSGPLPTSFSVSTQTTPGPSTASSTPRRPDPACSNLQALPSIARSGSRSSAASSRAKRSSPALHTPQASDASASDRQLDPFFSPTVLKRRESDEDMAHNRTPLLHPIQYPEPKETHKLTKDYDAAGNKRINDYEVIKKLGSGTHGTVKLGRNLKTNHKVAIKIVRRYPKKGRLGKHETPEDKVKKEIAVLKKARHPHVVSLLEVIDDPEFGKVYLILEFVERGEIVWRKPTDHDIAVFEMHRVDREIVGQIDEPREVELLASLNERLHSKLTGVNDMENDELRNQFEPPPVEPFELTPSAGQPGFQTEAAWPPASGLEPTTEPHHGDRPRPESEQEERSWRSYSRASSRDPLSAFGPSHGGSQEDSAFFDEDAWTQANDVEHAARFLHVDAVDPAEWTAEEEEYRYVPCLTLGEARDAFKDTVLGLEYLHFHGIIHRDIKPANLLWTADYRVKISDFGVSYLGRPIRPDEDNDDMEDPDAAVQADEIIELAKTVGTPAFYAPELCDPDLFNAQRAEAPRPQLTGAIDVWALGVTLYAMIFGRLPFWDRNEFQMYDKIAHHDVFVPRKRLRGVDDTSPMPTDTDKRPDHVVQYEDVDDTLRDLLKRLLEKDPARRINLKEVKHHPWVLEGVADKVAWIDLTDPSLKDTLVKKIEISSKDVETAVQPLNIIDRLKGGIRRLTSVVRGRETTRKRAETTASSTETSAAGAASNPGDREARRGSLKPEDMATAIRGSREHAGEHPLAQSTVASPMNDDHPGEFPVPVSFIDPASTSASASASASELSLAAATAIAGSRPNTSARQASTAESVLTVRPSLAAAFAGLGPGLEPPVDENNASSSLNVNNESATSSSSSLSRLLGTTGRRLVQRVRSREPGRTSRDSSGPSTRASSTDNLSAAASLAADHEHPHSAAASTAFNGASAIASAAFNSASAVPSPAIANAVPGGHVPAMVSVSHAHVHGQINPPPLLHDGSTLTASSQQGPTSPSALTGAALHRISSSSHTPALPRQSSAEGLGQLPIYAVDSGDATVRRRAQTTASGRSASSRPLSAVSGSVASPPFDAFATSRPSSTSMSVYGHASHSQLDIPAPGMSSDEQLTSGASESFSAAPSMPSVGSRASSPPVVDASSVTSPLDPLLAGAADSRLGFMASAGNSRSGSMVSAGVSRSASMASRGPSRYVSGAGSASGNVSMSGSPSSVSGARRTSRGIASSNPAVEGIGAVEETLDAADAGSPAQTESLLATGETITPALMKQVQTHAEIRRRQHDENQLASLRQQQRLQEALEASASGGSGASRPVSTSGAASRPLSTTGASRPVSHAGGSRHSLASPTGALFTRAAPSEGDTETGYHADNDDEGSDDEGIVMGG